MKVATEVDVAIGARVHNARLAAGLSQGALGETLGVTFQQVQKYEKGTNRISGSRLKDTAVALGTTVAAIVGEDPAAAPPVPLDASIFDLNRRLMGMSAKRRSVAVRAMRNILDQTEAA